jgi:CheY-like chemotaxis protein
MDGADAGALLQLQAGVDVVLANNGQEALDTLANDRQFSAVLMDCQMPVMDGYEATRRIRLNSGLKDLVVIAMTADAMSSDRERVQQAGMNDYIAKPVNVPQMFATLARWVGDSAGVQRSAGDGHLTSAAGDLSAIVGIDAAAGMASMLGNADLYRRQLNKFLQSQSAFEVDFRSAVASGDLTGAQRLAHTLKGNAGTIGAKVVQFHADALEQSCGQGLLQDVETSLQCTVTSLELVLEGLRNVAGLSPAPEMPPPGTEDQKMTDALSSELVFLRTQLQSADPEALDTVQQLLGQSLPSAVRTTLLQLVGILEKFEFEMAESVLREHSARW